MGRPLGSVNKRSGLLKKLFENHNFNYVGRFVDFFEKNWAIWEPIMDKMIANQMEKLPVTTGLTLEEMDLFKFLNPEIARQLATTLSYCHPKMRSIEMDQAGGNKMNISLTIPPKGDQAAPGQKLLTTEGKEANTAIDIAVGGSTITMDAEKL